MPQPDFYIKQHDTASVIEDTLEDDNSAPVNIQAATVAFHMRPLGSSVAKVNAAASNEQNGDGGDGTKGQVQYAWAASDTDTAGTFTAEWEVTFANQAVQTYPNDRPLIVEVLPDVA